MELWVETVLYRIISTLIIFMYTSVWFYFMLEQPQPMSQSFWYMFWATIISTSVYYIFRLNVRAYERARERVHSHSSDNDKHT